MLKPSFRCTECGHTTAKWMGFCPMCRTTASLLEQVRYDTAAAAPLVAATEPPVTRISSGVDEFDRVLGSGLVPASVVLLGGEPGVGKSTLLLQVAAGVCLKGGRVLIASGEESKRQVADRARRIGALSEAVMFTAEQSVDRIVAAAATSKADIVIVDSMQTVRVDGSGAAPGSVTQVRESVSHLVAFAKSSATPVLLIGHVTKDGSLAGPKLVEHMVDAVLVLEGESHSDLRFLRGLKNRFGPVNRTGVFEMAGSGLIEVSDPSLVLTSARDPGASGTVLFPAVNGRTPFLVEIQALVGTTRNPQPRRSVKGLPSQRVHQVLAVLERHGGMPLQAHEVYVSAMGGVRVDDPGSDLPVALAVASSLMDVPIGDVVAWGEIGLTGELRAPASGERRREEAARLGSFRVAAPSDAQRTLEAGLRAAGIGPFTARRTGLRPGIC